MGHGEGDDDGRYSRIISKEDDTPVYDKCEPWSRKNACQSHFHGWQCVVDARTVNSDVLEETRLAHVGDSDKAASKTRARVCQRPRTMCCGFCTDGARAQGWTCGSGPQDRDRGETG